LQVPSLNKTARTFLALTAVCGWVGLLLQFPLTLANTRSLGMTSVGGIVTYFSFFTILTNFLIAIQASVAACLPGSNLGRFFLRPSVTAACTVYIAFVGGGYSLLLRHIWDPEGLQKIADVLLHDMVPLIFVLCWLIYLPKARLAWKALLPWLGYPLAYLIFVLLRGALTQRYPYYFIDVTKLGYPRVLFHSALLLCALLVLSSIVLAISRRLSRDAVV
jgi:hypothetical protein